MLPHPTPSMESSFLMQASMETRRSHHVVLWALVALSFSELSVSSPFFFQFRVVHLLFYLSCYFCFFYFKYSCLFTLVHLHLLHLEPSLCALGVLFDFYYLLFILIEYLLFLFNSFSCSWVYFDFKIYMFCLESCLVHICH